MLLEGLHLYVLLVRVFQPAWLRVWHALVSGYGLPAVIVICSAIAYPDGYGTTQYCWLTLDRGFRWSFQGPVCLIVAVRGCNPITPLTPLTPYHPMYHPMSPHIAPYPPISTHLLPIQPHMAITHILTC
ncbi:CD97 antigen-like [Coturnix japonica]|uniref:CD97 antigen-like n=1 Tax=Coturnix japonica TaxID=93934 RepID=UPI000776FD8E|nr:CD97 antigen-like [Coturnix japonica]